MNKKWCMVVATVCLLVAHGEAFHNGDIDFDDGNLDNVLAWSLKSETIETNVKTFTNHNDTHNRTQQHTLVQSWYIYGNTKLEGWNAQYSPCGQECQAWMDWAGEILPYGYLKTSLVWIKYGVANPVLVVGRACMMIALWFLFRVVWVQLVRFIRWLKSRCCPTKHALVVQRRAGTKTVRFSNHLETDPNLHVVKTHTLVRIFVTPESHGKLGYIGVYMHTDAKDTSICHYPYTRPEHIELAKSRVDFQSTQIKCRPFNKSSGSNHQMLLWSVEKRSPVKVWSFSDASGKKITIDRMDFALKDCLYTTTGRRRDAPVIDVYGTIHESMRAFLCNSEPLSMNVPGAKIVPSKSAVTTQAIACTGDVCAVKPLPQGTQAVEWAPHDLDEIRHNTDRLVKILKAKEAEMKQVKLKAQDGEIDSGEAWSRLVATCGQFGSLMAQIDPAANSSVFCLAKRFFGFLSFASQLHTNGPVNALISPPTFDLESLSKGTNIEYGDPIDYDEFCRMAKPGDMIAVHGVHAMSRIICNLQGKIKNGQQYLSHVIMVVDTTVFFMPGMVPGEKYGIEACTGGGMIDDSYDVLPDVFGISKSGVQVRSLRGLLSESAKQHSLYLWCPLNAENRAKFDSGVGIHRDNLDVPCKLVSNLYKYLNRPYTLTPANFFVGSSNSNMDSSYAADAVRDMLTSHAMRYQSPMGSEYFCSELVGDLYIDTGILQPKRKIPHGANLGDLVTNDEMAESFFVGRQLFPLDYFLCHSKIPYLFDTVRVIHPTTKTVVVS